MPKSNLRILLDVCKDSSCYTAATLGILMIGPFSGLIVSILGLAPLIFSYHFVLKASHTDRIWRHVEYPVVQRDKAVFIS